MTQPAILLLGMLTLIAAGVTAAAQGELPKQRVSFFALEVPAARTSVQLLTKSDTFSTLKLPGANATPPMAVVNPDGNITIYDAPVTGPAGKITHPVLGTIKSSLQWPEAMVILLAEQKDGKDQFTGFAFPMSKNDLPPGSIKFANLSPCAIRGILGDSKLLFLPGKIETIKLTGEPGAMINVVFQYQDGDTWQRMMATQWGVNEQERTLVVAFKNPLTGTMTSRSIPLRDD